MTLARLALGFTLALSFVATPAWSAFLQVRQGAPSPPYFPTIQAAVDVASSGDVILVHPGAYREKVVVTIDDLTIRGLRPGSKKPISQIDDFKGYLTDLSRLGLAYMQVLDQCPTVQIAPCPGPGTCSGDAIDVDANEFTAQNLTILHSNDGIDLTGNDGLIENVCSINNSRLLRSNGDRNTVRWVNVQGGDNAAVDMQGADIVVRNAYVRNGDGVDVDGDDFTVEDVACSVTNDGPCVEDDSDHSGGTIRRVVGVGAEEVVDVDGNGALVEWIFGALGGDDADGIEANTNGSTFRHLVLRDLSEHCIDLSGDENVIEDVTARECGSDSAEAAVDVQGNRNVLRNLSVLRNRSEGIQLNGDENVVEDSTIQFSGRSGVFIDEGSDNEVRDNVITDNYGEGVANEGLLTDVVDNVLVRNFGVGVCDSGGGTFDTISGNNPAVVGAIPACLVGP